MSKRSIATNDLTPGSVFRVRGRLGFGRLTSQIDGEELQKDINKRQQNGWIPIDRPYTTATINQAQVVYQTPGQKLPEEIYAEESLYTSRAKRAQEQGGFTFTGVNKGYDLPWVGQLKAGTQSVIDQVIPEGELDNNLDVTLVMRVFKGKPNNGVTLDGVIVNEPIKYYNNQAAGAGLEELGITFNKADIPEVVEETKVDTPPVQETTVQQQQQQQGGNPYQAAPVQQQEGGNPYQAAPQQQAPQQASMPQEFAQGQIPQAQPAQTNEGNDEGGIRYNPNTDRNY